MTALRSYARDLALPGRLGESRLAPPAPEEAAWLFGHVLLRGGESGRAVDAELETVRWKPGVSCSAAYRVTFEDGSEERCALKAYASGKAAELAERRFAREHAGSFAVFPERGLAVWSAAGDRELSGLVRLLDRRQLARWVEESGCAPERSVRRRRTRVELLRYKPERRAIARVALSLRGSEPGQLRLAARFHPLDRAARIARMRRVFESQRPGVAPTLAFDVPHAGALFEPWLDLEEQEPTNFALTPVVGELLGRLHGLELPAGLRARAVPDPAGARALLAVDPELPMRLDAWLRARPDLGAARATWTHGDVHPDQLARLRANDTWALMDLDEVAPGDPHADLASWLADWLWEEEGVPYGAAEAELLASYGRFGSAGRACDRARLRTATGDALVARAASAIRRLQEGAVERAHAAFDRIERELTPGGER